MGRPLPRIPEDGAGFKLLVGAIILTIVLGCLIGYLNRQAADKGTTGETSSHQKSVPTPTIQNSN